MKGMAKRMVMVWLRQNEAEQKNVRNVDVALARWKLEVEWRGLVTSWDKEGGR